MKKINLAEKLRAFDDHWNPRIVAEFNGQHLKLAKFLGEFVWHKHEEEDELFLVVAGEIVIELRDGSVTLGPGECYVVPRGVEHRPVAKAEAHVMMLEPISTRNTGSTGGDRTIEELQWI